MNTVKKISKKISINIIVLTILVLPVIISAQTPINPVPGAVVNIPNPTSQTSIMGVITALLNNVVMPIATVAVVLWIIYAGFTFLTAQGNPKLIEDAKQRLLWSLIGAGILLGAAAISAVVQRTVCQVAATTAC